MSLKLKVEQLIQKEHIHKNIIKACIKGDDRARYELYQLYAKAMFNVCYRIMNNREEAEDMLQEAFTQAFIKLNSFRYESNFGSWLKRIAINTCINSLNKRKVELSYCEDIFQSELIDEDSDMEPEFTVKQVTKALEQIPAGGRMVFTLYLLEGYDHVEISQILGITESTSKSQLMRAKKHVMKILNEFKTA